MPWYERLQRRIDADPEPSPAFLYGWLGLLVVVWAGVFLMGW